MKGELKAFPLSDKTDLLKPYTTVLLLSPEGVLDTLILKSIRRHNKFFIISFEGIQDRETASKYRNSTVNIRREELPPLEEGEYYYDQIIGLSVYTTEGDLVGRVEGIFSTGSNDVYVVKVNDKEFLIPAIKDVIKKIEIGKNRIIIEAVKGLLD